MIMRVLGTIAFVITPILVVAPARADAWGASWGRVDGAIQPQGQYSSLAWNPLAENWLLHSEAEVHHYHPAHTSNYGADSEIWDPAGDGFVGVGPVETGDLARVYWVNAAVASAGGPYVDLNSPQNVYSYAHDPASMSDAAGLGQHDNLFRIIWTGDPGQQPPSVLVNFGLSGTWNLEGGSDLDDNWWADLLAYGEVYDALGNTLGSDSEYHMLSGPGPASDGGNLSFGFSAELQYNTPYSFNFWLSAESHAVAIPEPATPALLAVGLLALCHPRYRLRRRCDG